MKTLIFFLLFSCLACAEAPKAKTVAELFDEDVERRNAQVVEENLRLCADSGCSPCGFFDYGGSYVFYERSYCEILWLDDHQEALRREASDSIVNKYRKAK